MISDAIYKRLSGFAGLTALVGLRIYPTIAPQTTALPYIVYQQIGVGHTENLRGSSGLARSTFQISAHSTNYRNSHLIAEQLRLALQGHSDITNPDEIDHIHLESDRDDHDPPASGGGVGIYSVQSDFAVWYIEPIPVLGA